MSVYFTEKLCPNTYEAEDANVVEIIEAVTLGSCLAFQCPEGYNISSNVSDVCCHNSKQWIGEEPTCSCECFMS